MCHIFFIYSLDFKKKCWFISILMKNWSIIDIHYSVLIKIIHFKSSWNEHICVATTHTHSPFHLGIPSALSQSLLLAPEVTAILNSTTIHCFVCLQSYANRIINRLSVQWLLFCLCSFPPYHYLLRLIHVIVRSCNLFIVTVVCCSIG